MAGGGVKNNRAFSGCTNRVVEVAGAPLADARRWVAEGIRLFAEVVGLDEASYDHLILLPGWTHRQLVAHVAVNADAIEIWCAGRRRAG